MKNNASNYNMYMDQQDAQILVIRLYFPLDALHVSDYVSPSSGATFISCISHLVYADTCGNFTVTHFTSLQNKITYT